MSEAVQLCSFRVDEDWMGLNLHAVQELLPARRIWEVPLAPRHITGLINLRGAIVSVVDLRPLFGLPMLRQYDSSMLAVLRHDERRIAIVVDRVGDALDFYESEALHPPANLQPQVKALVSRVFPYEGELLIELDFARLLQSMELVHSPSEEQRSS